MESTGIAERSKLLEARIPAEKIDNYVLLKKNLQRIRMIPRDMQSETLEKLFKTTPIMRGQDKLLNEVMNQITRPKNQEPTEVEEAYGRGWAYAASQIREKVEGPEFEGVLVRVDESGKIIDAVIQEIYPQEDEEVTKRRLGLDKLPNGPGKKLVHVSDVPNPVRQK